VGLVCAFEQEASYWLSLMLSENHVNFISLASVSRNWHGFNYMNPDSDREKIEAHKRMGDLLVQFGLASSVRFNDTTRTGDIVWTDKGSVFRSILHKTYDELSKGKGKRETMLEFLNLLTFILSHR
jgi:hypothetical protein